MLRDQSNNTPKTNHYSQFWKEYCIGSLLSLRAMCCICIVGLASNPLAPTTTLFCRGSVRRFSGPLRWICWAVQCRRKGPEKMLAPYSLGGFPSPKSSEPRALQRRQLEHFHDVLHGAFRNAQGIL